MLDPKFGMQQYIISHIKYNNAGPRLSRILGGGGGKRRDKVNYDHASNIAKFAHGCVVTVKKTILLINTNAVNFYHVPNNTHNSIIPELNWQPTL